METLDRNLAALAARQPEVARKIAAAPRQHIAVIRTGQGINLRDKKTGVYLHAPEAPLQEARDVAGGLPVAPQFIALGMGNGFHLHALHRRYPAVPLIIVEPRADIAAQALRLVDLSGLLSRPEVWLLIDDDADRTAEWIVAQGKTALDRLGRVTFLELAAAGKLYPRYVERFRKRLAERTQAAQRTRLTLLKFALTWNRHFWQSLPLILQLPSVACLAGRGAGYPAFIIGGGPSLDAAYPWLAQVVGRGLIVAVDTALPSLLAAGVQPDIVITLDAGWGNATSLLNRTTDAHLAAFPLVVPEVLREYAGRTVAFNMRHPSVSWLSAIRPPIHDLRVSGSVATAAYDLARNLGCDPILLVGVDLTMDEGRMYTRGSWYYEKWRDEVNRWRSLEGCEQQLHNELDFRAGSRVVTRQMDFWRHWLQREAFVTKARTYDCSYRGEGIDGIPRVPLEKFIAKRLPTRAQDWRQHLWSAHPPRASSSPEIIVALQRLAAEAARVKEQVARIVDTGRLPVGLVELPVLWKWEMDVVRWQEDSAQRRTTIDEMITNLERGVAEALQ